MTDLNLFSVLDFHYKNKSHLTPVLLKPEDGVRKKLTQFNNETPEDYIVYALEEGTQRLLNGVLSSEMNDPNKGFPFKTVNLMKHPRVYFQSLLDESNIIICDKRLINLFAKYGPEFGTVTQDFIPFLVQNQYNTNLVNVFNGVEESDEGNSIDDTEIDIFLQKRLQPESQDSFRPYAFITSDYCVKINSLQELFEANILAATNGKPKSIGCFNATINDPVRIEIKDEEPEEAPAVEEKPDATQASGKNAGKK